MQIIRDIVHTAAVFLAGKGIDSARLDAELLLCHVLGIDRVRLFMDLDRPLLEDEVHLYREYIAERGRGCPTAYITGYREFYSMNFAVSPDVLIPRPDTEHLVELARRCCTSCSRLVDLGTGSGILAVSLAKHLNAAATGVDISSEALAMAALNAERLAPDGSFTFVQSDWWANVDGVFDLVVANPPYITALEMEALESGVSRYEPHGALYGGTDGLGCYQAIISGLRGHLAPGGTLLLEISDTVAAGVEELAQNAGLQSIELHQDFSGHQRVLMALMP